MAPHIGLAEPLRYRAAAPLLKKSGRFAATMRNPEADWRLTHLTKVSEIIVVNHWFDDLILNLFLWGTPLAFTFLLCNRSLWR